MNTLLSILMAVLNSLWEAALLAALVWLLLRFAPRMNAATRFAIWWAALGAVLILPAAPRMIGMAREWSEPATMHSSRPLYAPSPKAVPLVTLAPLNTIEDRKAVRWPLWVAVVWGLLLLYRLAEVVRSYVYLRGVKQRASVSSEPLPPMGRAARLLVSSDLDSPIAAGFLHPAVILPAGLQAELSPEEMDHVLLHEAAHLARRDDWTKLLARVLGSVLALHPVALWILHRLEMEREGACDDWVIARTRSARPYAQSLVKLYELRLVQHECRRQLLASGIFGGGSRLFERVERLVRRGYDIAPHASLARVTASVIVLIALGAAVSLSPDWIAFAQSPRPAFDVASIKQHIGQMDGVTFSAGEGGRLTVVNNPIFNVIDNAYGIAKYQLVGAPDWVTSERYDIEARGSATAGKKEMMLMVQSLLADRFAMRAHFETREMPAYILTVAKGGPKLRFLGPEDCVPYDSTKPNPKAVPNVCGNNHVSLNNEWNATHISMRDVTGALSSAVMRRPVIDQTGIKGTFDLHLQWSDDLTLQDNPADAPPSIYVALRETLGLELKPGRGPAEVLVIDHIERPTGN